MKQHHPKRQDNAKKFLSFNGCGCDMLRARDMVILLRGRGCLQIMSPFFPGKQDFRSLRTQCDGSTRFYATFVISLSRILLTRNFILCVGSNRCFPKTYLHSCLAQKSSVNDLINDFIGVLTLCAYKMISKNSMVQVDSAMLLVKTKFLKLTKGHNLFISIKFMDVLQHS